MPVNRIFHYGLMGLQSTSCNEDESYSLEAAGWSFVPQYTHIIHPASLDQITHTYMLMQTVSLGEFLDQAH